MDGRKIVLLVAALLVAAVTAFMARSLMVGAAAPTAEAAAKIDGPEVLVATRALPVGTILDVNAMKFQPWPKDLVEGAYFIKDKDKPLDLKSLQGTVVRYAIPAGQPLTQGSLVKPGDRGFLAAALAPGMRAVTVPVSEQTSVAGFVFPGDRIDLILTQSVAGGDGPALKAAETVLRNLRVLATGQKVDKGVDEKGNTVVTNYSTVTLETTPKIAEKISVAQTIGSLSLSLRSIADNAGELEEAIASGDVNVPDGKDPNAEKKMLASMDARPSEGKGTYSTGADVSRFQRRSVPTTSSNGSGGAAGSDRAAAAPVIRMPIALKQPTVRVARGNDVTDVPVGDRPKVVMPSNKVPFDAQPAVLPNLANAYGGKN